MILYIDTTDFNKATFVLSGGKKILRRSHKIDSHRSHETLAKLDEFLKKTKISNLKPALPAGAFKIRRIVVNKGPGSYTGVRVGISLAMALGLGWNVPVRAVGADKFQLLLKDKNMEK